MEKIGNLRTKLYKNKVEAGILSYLILLFGFFFFCFEVKEYGDSFQFLLMFPTRDPVYSLFLKCCRILAGEELYFGLIGFLQNTLAIASIWFLNEYITKTFQFCKGLKVLSAFLLTLPHIMTPLFSSSHLVLTNAILTEGISISLFYLWMILMLRLLYKESMGNDFSALVMAVMLSLIRGQLLICICAWVVVMSIKLIIRRKWIGILWTLLTCLVLLAGRTVFVQRYNDYFWDMPVSTFSGNPMMVANVLYVAEPEDGEKLKTPYLRELFDSIIIKMKEDKICYSDAEDGFLQKALFHDEVHDRINFDYFEPATREYLKETAGLDEMNYIPMMYQVDRIAGELARELLPHVFGRYAVSYISIVSLGLMRSIAVEFAWLIPYVFLAYIAAFVGSVFMLYKYRQNENRKKAALMMLFVLMLIFGNAMATALMLQCISRYMIYNFPLFYIAVIAIGKTFLGRNRSIIKA